MIILKVIRFTNQCNRSSILFLIFVWWKLQSQQPSPLSFWFKRNKKVREKFLLGSSASYWSLQWVYFLVANIVDEEMNLLSIFDHSSSLIFRDQKNCSKRSCLPLMVCCLKTVNFSQKDLDSDHEWLSVATTKRKVWVSWTRLICCAAY